MSSSDQTRGPARELLWELAQVLLVTAVLGFILATPIALLWEGIMREVFGLPSLSFWQAFCLYTLVRLLLQDI